ncbi:PAS domain-containing protein [Streptomyces sp. M19]
MTKQQTRTLSPWRALLETAPGAALIVDRHGIVVDVNSAACALLPGTQVGVSLARSPVPDWLADAQAAALPDTQTTVSGTVADCPVHARACRCPAGSASGG